MKLPQLCSAPDFDERWLEPGAVVPVIPPNLGAALREVQRLRDLLTRTTNMIHPLPLPMQTPRADKLARELARYGNDAHKVIDLLALAQSLERDLIGANHSLSDETQSKQRFARELLTHVTGKSYYDNGTKMRARWCLLCDTETPPDAERLTHKPGCLAAEAEEAAK